jgi:hypothetical protein
LPARLVPRRVTAPLQDGAVPAEGAPENIRSGGDSQACILAPCLFLSGHGASRVLLSHRKSEQ